jgi:multidrug resistance efflux pump
MKAIPKLVTFAMIIGAFNAQAGTTALSAGVAAKLIAVNVKVGDHVVEGQKLARLDCSSFEAELNLNQIQLDRLSKEFAANTRLYELGAIGKLELDASDAGFQTAQVNTKVAENQVNSCDIKAPMTGYVVGFGLNRNEYAPVGQKVIVLSNSKSDIMEAKVVKFEVIRPSNAPSTNAIKNTVLHKT